MAALSPVLFAGHETAEQVETKNGLEVEELTAPANPA